MIDARVNDTSASCHISADESACATDQGHEILQNSNDLCFLVKLSMFLHSDNALASHLLDEE